MTLRVLVADKGLMATRIARTLRDMEFQPLGVYTAEDKDSIHRRLFSEDAEISGYDDTRDIISAALELGADGIHPGSSDLASDPEFAREVIRKGLVFVGPPPDTISLLRDKLALKTLAEKIGVPVLPWIEVSKSSDILAFTAQHQFPVLLRPARGYGLSHAEVAWSEHDLNKALGSVKKKAEKKHGDSGLIVEPFIPSGKLLEVQVLGDGDNIVHLYERECILDHRYVKIGEESPSPSIKSEDRAKLYEYALTIATSLRLVNTVVLEFIYEPVRRQIYFLDAVPGLTYEHSSTEMVTRKDIVRKQIEISFYSALDLRQRDITIDGYAIGVKITNKDPVQDRCSTGKITSLSEPSGSGIRVESSIYPGYEIRGEPEMVLSKLTIWSTDRRTGIARLINALSDYVIEGISTNLHYLKLITSRDWFNSGDYAINTIKNEYRTLIDKLKETAIIHAVALSAIYELDEKKLSKFARRQKPLESILRSEKVSSVKRSAWYYYVSLKTMLERRHSSRRTREKPH